jgi:hypothetical protein
MNVRDRLFPYCVITSKIFISNHNLSVSVPRNKLIFTRDTPKVTIKVFTIKVLAFRVVVFITKNVIISE